MGHIVCAGTAGCCAHSSARATSAPLLERRNCASGKVSDFSQTVSRLNTWVQTLVCLIPKPVSLPSTAARDMKLEEEGQQAIFLSCLWLPCGRGKAVQVYWPCFVHLPYSRGSQETGILII